MSGCPSSIAPQKPPTPPAPPRRIFQSRPLTLGIAICHEGWRYPETVRWAARQGAHIVFHTHFHQAEPGSCRPPTFADPANSFHEKAALCRAAEKDDPAFYTKIQEQNLLRQYD